MVLTLNIFYLEESIIILVRRLLISDSWLGLRRESCGATKK